MGWSAWDWDPLTAAWVAWMLAFVALESVALVRYPGQELTAHLRPVFAEHPLTWWLAAGCWAWLFFHFLAWRWEAAVVEWMTQP